MSIKAIILLVAAIAYLFMFLISAKIMVEEKSIACTVAALYSALAMTLLLTAWVFNCGWF